MMTRAGNAHAPRDRHEVTGPGRIHLAQLSAPGRVALQAINLSVQAGEIVAIAGVSGNGQRTLAAVLSGETAATSGRLLLDGQPLPARPRAFIDAGIARIPEDRVETGVIGEASLVENAYAHRPRDPAALRAGPLARWLGLSDRSRMRAEAARIIQRYDVRHRHADQSMRTLSGGNIQKFILGRELARDPGIIIANQPTWGLDIGAVGYIHSQLRAARDRGAAVLLISEDLDEIFALADRVAVMAGGRLSDAQPTAHWNAATIGLAMAGSHAA